MDVQIGLLFSLSIFAVWNFFGGVLSISMKTYPADAIENIIFALAGGLGVDSKILLKNDCFWFNGHNDIKSYWFTNQTFYRQKSTEDWGKELSQIRKEIVTLI